MKGNLLLAVLTLMVAMLLLVPAIIGRGDRRATRKKGAAAAAGPHGYVDALAHTELRSRRARNRKTAQRRSTGPGIRPRS